MNTQPSAKDTYTEQSLYEQDYYLWLTTTVDQLRQGKLAEIDLANLIEEIADMGRSERKAVRSNLRILLMHLLKYKYQPEKRTNSWLFTIREHRQRIDDSFQDSPSLQNYFLEVFDQCYRDAVDFAATETGLPATKFPSQCPFTAQEVLGNEYLPQNDDISR